MTQKEVWFEEGCFIQEWHNENTDAAVSVAHVRVPPHAATRLHRLQKTVERYIMLTGNARVTVGDKSWTVAPGEVVTIEAGQAQKIRNLGDDELKFLAVCTPRFQVHNYQDIDPEPHPSEKP